MGIPIPVSVTLYNLVAFNRDDQHQVDDGTEDETLSSARRSWFRPNYSSDLLVPVTLYVLLKAQSSQIQQQLESLQSMEEDRQDELVLFSSHQDRGAIHPCWDHLDERGEFWQSHDVDWDPVYRSLRLRILASRDNDSARTTVADMPLHPALLRRLPEDGNIHSNHEVNTGLISWEPKPPPRALPPNAVLIQFSDGSTRVHPPLYHLLLERRIIVERDPSDALLLQDDAEESRRTSRFTDHDFDKLDQAVWAPKKKKKERRIPSPASLLETDDERQAVPVSPLQEDGAEEDMIYEDQETFPSLLEAMQGDENVDGFAQEIPTREHRDSSQTKDEEDSITLAELRQRRTRLQEMIELEETLLAQEKQRLQFRETELKTVSAEVRQLEEETKTIRLETEKASVKRKEMDFLLEAQRIKLLRDLRTIYPIHSQSEYRYFIRGQEIPSDLHAGAVPEEELSAALGFLCHTIIMMSKYLSVPLRHRIVSNSSRSAIQEDTGKIYPLFQARMVDRLQLDKGMQLLNRNVECILKSRGVSCSEESTHLLAKVKRIYDSTIEGR